LRVGELTGLDIGASGAAAGWVDRADATAHVLGKGSKRRSVPIGRAALAALDAWLLQRGPLARSGEAALFVSRRGTRLTASQVRSRLKGLALQAGLPTSVHPHMLRHSYASHLLQSSGDLRAVQELLGHASISSTQVYTRLDLQHLAKVYDAAHPRARKKGPPRSGLRPPPPEGATPANRRSRNRGVHWRGLAVAGVRDPGEVDTAARGEGALAAAAAPLGVRGQCRERTGRPR
jgi:hypothetical protein